MLLAEETDLSVFCCSRPSAPSLNREKWDPGVGSSWAAVPKEPFRGGVEVGFEDEGVGGDEDGVAELGSNVEEGKAVGKKNGKRKRPRGPGSRFSRKRGGRDLREAGSNAASRKVRIAEKWVQEGTSYRTTGYSLAEDGSHSSTGWQGRAPPAWKRQEVMKAYQDGSIFQTLGIFFPVPYQQWVHFLIKTGVC
jgi:hypothetical protein